MTYTGRCNECKEFKPDCLKGYCQACRQKFGERQRQRPHTRNEMTETMHWAKWADRSKEIVECTVCGVSDERRVMQNVGPDIYCQAHYSALIGFGDA